jgi:fructokinase
MSDRPSAERATIVCFGEALIDLLAHEPPEAPAPRQFTEYAGGAPANVAVAVARLGGTARFIGMLGEDLFGDRLLAKLQRAGVDVGCVRRTAEAKTALAFVSLDAQGERSFSFYRPPAADLLFREAHFEARCFEGAAVFHICSNSLTEPAIAQATLGGMRRARAAGTLLSMDLNLRPSLWPRTVDPVPRLWEALLEADLVKLSRGELQFLAPSAGGVEAALQRLLQARAQCVLLTDGAAPVRWFTRTSSGSVPAFSVRVVDTTAAGDAFVGGWLKSLTDRGTRRETLGAFLDERAQLAECVRYGAACGALATTRHGAFAAMPAEAEVRTLLQARP